MTWRIEPYTPDKADEWNAFVRESRNGTFLFDRGYMDYHSDRFRDFSWMVYKKSRLVALLPANITSDGIMQSHGGLTYGGWILPVGHLDGADLLSIFYEAIQVWRECGIRRLDYKTIPYIYASHPSQEDEYALFRLGATLTASALSSTIDLRSGARFNTMQKRHLAKALKLGAEVKETDDIDAFMSMLADCLKERHDTKPVHTAEEMKLLKSRFPDNIRFFVTLIDGQPEAGVCVYDTGCTAHAQYIATTARGREENLLAPLFDYLIQKEFCDCNYFDFGISTENGGNFLNEGLLRQKSSYGASGTLYSLYSLDLTRDLKTLQDL